MNLVSNPNYALTAGAATDLGAMLTHLKVTPVVAWRDPAIEGSYNAAPDGTLPR